MIITTENNTPDVIIRMKWEQAQLLRLMIDGIGGSGAGRKMNHEIADGLSKVGVTGDDDLPPGVSFDNGYWRQRC